jgi:hypothetical protein
MGVNVTGSGSCPKKDFIISDVEHNLPDIFYVIQALLESSLPWS